MSGPEEPVPHTLGKSIAAAAFALLASLPAAAQVGFRADIPLPGLEIRIGRTAPPSRQHERRPTRPGRDYVWLRGSWDWQGSDWVWVPGRWERPGHRSARWVDARYTREGQVWRYEPAHWSHERLTPGDDYRRWQEESRRGQGNHHGHQKDGDRDHR